MKTKIVMFEYEKATKNTVKFSEAPSVGEPPVIGALYIQHWFCPSMGPGTKARLTLEVQEGGKDTFPEERKK